MTSEFFEGKTDQEIVDYLKSIKAQLDLGSNMDTELFIQLFFNIIDSGIAESRNLDIRLALSSIGFSFFPKFLGDFTDAQVLALADSPEGLKVLEEIITITTVQGISYRDYVDLRINAAKESTAM